MPVNKQRIELWDSQAAETCVALLFLTGAITQQPHVLHIAPLTSEEAQTRLYRFNEDFQESSYFDNGLSHEENLVGGGEQWFITNVETGIRLQVHAIFGEEGEDVLSFTFMLL